MVKNSGNKSKRRAARAERRRIALKERKAEQRQLVSRKEPVVSRETSQTIMSMNSSRNSAKSLSALMEGWTMFARSNAQAYYEFYSQMISMPDVKREDVEWVSQNPNFSGITSIHGTVLHEITHWLDHSSTVWGRENLIRYFNALNAWQSQDEEAFHQIISAFAAMHEIRLPGYYSTLVAQVPLSDPPEILMTKLTCGFSFDPNGKLRRDRPIIFGSFLRQNGEFICRTPLSITALSECCAVAAQYELMAAIQGVFEGAAHLELAQHRKAVHRLNDPELALYSIAMHCFANYASVTDVAVAYRKSSMIARLCLNLPPHAFLALKVPPEFSDGWKDACIHLLANRNPGFAFLVLSWHAGRAAKAEGIDWLDSTLQSAGLPTLDALTVDVEKAIHNPETAIVEGPFRKRLEDILAVGARNFRRRRGIAGLPVTIDQLSGDDAIEVLPIRIKGSWWRLPGTPSEPTLQDPDDWLQNVEQVLSGVMGFVDACARAPT